MTPALRSDAVRSRALILDAARAMPPSTLRLNAVAHAAGLGVGTVYRHFASVQALHEALALEHLQKMADLARRAADSDDPAAAALSLIRNLAQMQFEHEGVQTALLSPDPTPETADALTGLYASFSAVLEAAVAAGVIRADVSIEQIQHLICGMEYTIRLTGQEHRDTIMSVLLAGLRASPWNDLR